MTDLTETVDNLTAKVSQQAKRIKELEKIINYAIGGIDALSESWDEKERKDILAVKQTLEQAQKGGDA